MGEALKLEFTKFAIRVCITIFNTGLGLQDFSVFNPLPDMPLLGSSNSTANKDMMSKIWTNGDTVI